MSQIISGTRYDIDKTTFTGRKKGSMRPRLVINGHQIIYKFSQMKVVSVTTNLLGNVQIHRAANISEKEQEGEYLDLYIF